MLAELCVSVIVPSFGPCPRQPLPSTGSLGSVPPLHRLLRAARTSRRPSCLASGWWTTFTGRDLNPLGPIVKFRQCLLHRVPLTQALPGAPEIFVGCRRQAAKPWYDRQPLGAS